MNKTQVHQGCVIDTAFLPTDCVVSGEQDAHASIIKLLDPSKLCATKKSEPHPGDQLATHSGISTVADDSDLQQSGGLFLPPKTGKKQMKINSCQDSLFERSEKNPKDISSPQGCIYVYSQAPKDAKSQSLTVKKHHVINSVTQKKCAPIKIKPDEKPSEYTDIMRKRWAKANQYLPVRDKKDIQREVPLVNGGQVKPLESRAQMAAEFTQASYLSMRRQEEGLSMYNYFDPDASPGFKKFIDSLDDFFQDQTKHKREICRSKVLNHLLSENDRAYAVQKIFSLHKKKRYRTETCFTAVTIMDRYLASIGHWTFPREHTCLLAMTSLLLAAKMDESLAPNFESVISFLAEEEKKEVTVKALAIMESEVLIALGFDLSVPGPVVSIERFLHLLKVDDVPIIRQMTDQICKFALNDAHFLKYRPSQLAAAATILNINIFRRDKEQVEQSEPLKDGEKLMTFFYRSRICDDDGKRLLRLNTSVWSKPQIVAVTGYSVETLRQCLYDLGMFVRENLKPDRLAGFDLESILDEENAKPDVAEKHGSDI